MDEKIETAILGGGLSGLTLAYLLDKNGISDFLLLEKNSECGGLMRSAREQGFTFDIGGSHIIFSKDKKILNFMVHLLKDNVVRNRRNTKILYKNRYVKYPFENGLADLPKEDNFECLYYFIQNLIKRKIGKIDKPKNFKEWCYYTFGKGIAEKYLIPYNEKIWKYPLEKIGLEWVERVPNPSAEDIIKSSLGIETEGYTHQLYFYYPKYGGIQSLIKSLETPVRKKIVTHFEIKEIERTGSRWVISNGREKYEFDKIVSTIPLPELVKVLKHVPTQIKEIVNRLKFNSLITVALGVNTPKINHLSWLYIPDKYILPHRVSFPSNYSPYVSPEDKSLILAEITCNYGDEIFISEDENISKKVIGDLHALKIINKNDVCFSRVTRIKYAYVIPDLEYKENVIKLNEYFKNIGIILCGRFAQWKYMNMDACVEAAMKVADKLTAE